MFALLAMALSIGGVLVATIAVDVLLHQRADKYASVNVWGYRGATVGRKKPGEHRIVVVGGSTAFGYGVTTADAFPARLEAVLRPLAKQGAPLTVVNLGMNGQGAYAMKVDLEDYEYLDYDAVVLYEGYNDVNDYSNVFVMRRESPVYRLIGYYPIFPVVFEEKAMALRYGGDISAAYGRQKTVFRPGIAQRATATALQTAADITKSLQRQLDHLERTPGVRRDNAALKDAAHGCEKRWAHYCTALYDAIRYSLDRRRKVVVVTQPYLLVLHRDQQLALRGMLALEFPGAPDVKYVNLGPVFEPIGKDKALFYDGMHATAEGNRQIARRLAVPLTELMSDVFHPAAATMTTAAPPR